MSKPGCKEKSQELKMIYRRDGLKQQKLPPGHMIWNKHKIVKASNKKTLPTTRQEGRIHSTLLQLQAYIS